MDFNILKSKFESFANHMTIEISVQPLDFQTDLCDFLQSNINQSPKEF